MKTNAQPLTAGDYVEAIRQVRSNPPVVTYEESRQQYRESMSLDEPQPEPVRAEPSGDGLRKTAAA